MSEGGISKEEIAISIHTYTFTIAQCLLMAIKIHPPHHINTLIPLIIQMPLQGHQTRHMASMDPIFHEQQNPLQEKNLSTILAQTHDINFNTI